jgi:hypothetical protein
MESPVLKGWRDALTSGDEERPAAAKSELIVMQSEVAARSAGGVIGVIP